MRILLQFWRSIQRGPFGLILEEPHGFDVLTKQCQPPEFHVSSRQRPWENDKSWQAHILCIGSESMEDPTRQNDQVLLLQPDPHPLILLAPHIKESLPIQDVPDLLVFMQVLVEEHVHLLLIHVAHLVGRDGDLVAVPVGASIGDGVDIGDGGTAVVDHAELLEVVGRQVFAGVVVEALVALDQIGEQELRGRQGQSCMYLGVVVPVCLHAA